MSLNPKIELVPAVIHWKITLSMTLWCVTRIKTASQKFDSDITYLCCINYIKEIQERKEARENLIHRAWQGGILHFSSSCGCLAVICCLSIGATSCKAEQQADFKRVRDLAWLKCDFSELCWPGNKPKWQDFRGSEELASEWSRTMNLSSYWSGLDNIWGTEREQPFG